MKKNKKEKKRLCNPGLTAKGATLDEMLDCYCRIFRPVLKKYLGMFRSSNLANMMDYATGSVCPCCKHCHPHQWRVAKKSLREFEKKLKAIIDRLKQAKNFEKLYELVCEARVWGIGPVTLYDAALRIGACISILPRDFVYLHGGAKIPGNGRSGKLSISSFVPLFAAYGMTAYEIEEFLCCFHSLLSEKAIIVTIPSK